jgi:hypothetical protein
LDLSRMAMLTLLISLVMAKPNNMIWAMGIPKGWTSSVCPEKYDKFFCYKTENLFISFYFEQKSQMVFYKVIFITFVSSPFLWVRVLHITGQF